MKKLDKVIIISVVILSLLIFASYKILNNKKYDKTYAGIYVENSLIKKVELIPNHNEQFTINTKNGKNIVSVEGTKIRILDADCPDKICVKDGYISKPGQMLVCLPHKFMIEVKGETKEDIDGLSY